MAKISFSNFIPGDLILSLLNEFNSSFNIDDLHVMNLSKEDLAGKIDHTLLKPEATSEEIRKLCEEALEYKFASVCCNPFYVPLCRKLCGEKIKVCSVAGFPLGASAGDVKRYEAAKALSEGADEIDMVLNIGMLKEKNFSYVFDDICDVADETKKAGAVCKVILENCLLSDEEKIIACLIGIQAGVDFVKTSTGFNKSGATARDVALMKFAGKGLLKVKAAGGIRTRKDAELMIASGADRIGASASIKLVTDVY
jgi:deoxyribose-phosphate aldolase